MPEIQGIDAFLMKPVGKVELAENIRRLLDTSSGHILS